MALPSGMLTSFIIQSDHLAAATNVSLGILLSSPGCWALGAWKVPSCQLQLRCSSCRRNRTCSWAHSKISCCIPMSRSELQNLPVWGLEYERTQLSIHSACFSWFLLEGEKVANQQLSFLTCWHRFIFNHHGICLARQTLVEDNLLGNGEIEHALRQVNLHNLLEHLGLTYGPYGHPLLLLVEHHS